MKLRAWSLRRWLLLITAMIIATLIGLRLHIRMQLNRALADLRASGEPTTWEEYVRKHASSVDALRAGRTLTNAEWSIPQPKDDARTTIPGIGYANLPKPGESMTDEIRIATREYLNEASNEIAQINESLHADEVRYPIFVKGGAILDPQVGLSRKAISLLTTECIYAIDQTNVDKASRAAAAQFKICDSLYPEPGWIGQVTRFAMASVAAGDAERVLGCANLNSECIGLLQSAIRPMLSHTSLTNTIAGERVGFLGYSLPGGGFVPLDFGDNYDPDQWDTFWEKLKIQIYRMAGLADQDITWYLETSKNIEASLAGPLAEQQNLVDHWSDYQPSGNEMIFHLWSEQERAYEGKFIQKHIEMHAKLRALWAALAVAQYRLKHDGRLPHDLNELVPDYLEKVPIEPKSGKPFELIKTVDGFGIGRGTPVFKVLLNGAPRDPHPAK